MNRSQIGGSGLTVLSAPAAPAPVADGAAFSTLVSASGAQLLAVFYCKFWERSSTRGHHNRMAGGGRRLALLPGLWSLAAAEPGFRCAVWSAQEQTHSAGNEDDMRRFVLYLALRSSIVALNRSAGGVILRLVERGVSVTTSVTNYRKQALAELDAVPEEYLPFVIQFVRSFRESISLKPAAGSFRQGWEEARKGETYPLSSLWDDLDAD